MRQMKGVKISCMASSILPPGTTMVLARLIQDLQRARPTLFISVPRLWLKFQQGVFAKMPPAKLDRLLGIPLLGKLVAAKIRKGLGLDQVIAAASGSAPVSYTHLDVYKRQM